eukprot:3229422-Alexandrium_andersonii.AAC.1
MARSLFPRPCALPLGRWRRSSGATSERGDSQHGPAASDGAPGADRPDSHEAPPNRGGATTLTRDPRGSEDEVAG